MLRRRHSRSMKLAAHRKMGGEPMIESGPDLGGRPTSLKGGFWIVRCLKYVVSLVAVMALVVAGGASAFVVSHASSHVVQSQPPPR